MDNVSGQLWGGRYQAEDVLGRGGMATVWRGRDLRLDRPVAIKVLSGTASVEDPNAMHRFHREAQTVARLAHPNIVGVYDVGTDGDTPYLVLELVPGGSVSGLLTRGPLPVDRAVDIAMQTCRALAAAHAAGVVHRDIKPANLLLSADGTVKVCDFGIARLQGSAQAGLTAPATALGTSQYMAPEQAAGGPVDARTDLYALGCVIFTLLAGGPPFEGENPLAVLYQHLNQPAPALRSRRPDVPPMLDALVARLLAKDPAVRPASAGQTLELLQATKPGHVPDPLAPTSPGYGNPAFTVGPTPAGPAPTMLAPGGHQPAPAATPAQAVPPVFARAAAPVPAAPPPPPTGILPANAGWDTTGRGTSPGWTGPSRTRRPGLRFVGTALALVLIGVVAVAVLRDRSTDSGATGSGTPTVTSAPATSASRPTVPAPTPPARTTAPADPIAGLLTALERQVTARALSGKDAGKLRREIHELREDLLKGRYRDVSEQIVKITEQLAELRQDGRLSQLGYLDLTASLQSMIAGLNLSGQNGGDDNGNGDG